MTSIRVRFDGKVFIPEEPLDLPSGTQGVVNVESNGQPQSLLEWMAQHPVDDSDLPPDLAEQHDHYLYGTPKKEE